MATSPRPFVFVLMPFADSFNDVYEVAIRPACENAGAYAERVDKQIFTGSILDRVFNQITKADIVVADVSERNANVFYEVGYAHALGKRTVLVTRHELDIPFDLRQYPHIIYGDSLAKLRAELGRSIQWHLENPEKSASSADEVAVKVNGVDLAGHPEILILPKGEDLTYIAMDVAFQNKAERNVRTLSFRAGLFTSPVLASASNKSKQGYTALLVDERRIFMAPGTISLLPEQWDAVDFILQKRHERIIPGETFDCSVRVYFDSGSAEYPFRVRVQEPRATFTTNA